MVLSSDSFRTTDMTQPTRSRKYLVGKRIFERGFLIYGAGDYVDKEEAKRLDEVHGTNLVEEEESDPLPQKPNLSANKEAWATFAKTRYGIPVGGKSKQQLIDEVQQKEDEKMSGNRVESNDNENVNDNDNEETDGSEVVDQHSTHRVEEVEETVTTETNADSDSDNEGNNNA